MNEDGEFDADVRESGTSKTQRDRITVLEDIVEQQCSEGNSNGAAVEDVLDEAEAEGRRPEARGEGAPEDQGRDRVAVRADGWHAQVARGGRNHACHEPTQRAGGALPNPSPENTTEHGENPARFLVEELTVDDGDGTTGELMLARIRGLETIALCRFWLGERYRCACGSRPTRSRRRRPRGTRGNPPEARWG